MFVTRVQLLVKLTHVTNKYVEVTCVNKSQGLIVMYVIMKQMDFNHKCNDVTIIGDYLVFCKQIDERLPYY